MQRVIFDFDVVSPYAYLAFERLPAALEGLSHHVEYQPLLFAGLLKHWGNTAPVAVAPKKAWLFRQCAWIAQQEGIAFRPPTPHPFNPLALLRLLVASVPAGGQPNRRVVADAIAPVRDPASREVKDELQARTAAAAAAGVFGVPSFRLDDGQLFWGTDSMAMLADAMRRKQGA